MISLHNHTIYCDGKNTPLEMTVNACKKGITHFGITGHAPVPLKNDWSIGNMEAAVRYANELEEIAKGHTQLHFYKGLEADYIPGESYSFEEMRTQLRLNFIIGSVHLVKNKRGIWFIDGPAAGYDQGLKMHYQGNFFKAMKQYYYQNQEMLSKEKFEILAHCDKVIMNNNGRYISNDDPRHLSLLKETLMLAKEKNVWVEINTRGLYKGIYTDFFPGTYIFPFIKDEKIRIIFSADGHQTDQIIKGYPNFCKAVDQFGINNLVIRPEEIEERFG